MICNSNARMALELMAVRNNSKQPEVAQPVNFVWQIAVAYNRQHQISFAAPLCSSALPKHRAKHPISGSVSVSPITSCFLCANTPLNKKTDGMILH